MRKSRFQKQYKQKKSPQRPQCHKWHCHRCGHFFLYACTKNGQNRSYSHYFIHIQVAENATSTGHAKRGSVLVSIVGYNAPYLQTSLPSIADKATADNPVLRQCTTGGTPVTAAMHAWQWRSQDFHTAVGKPTFPLFVAPPLIYPHGAARQYICPFSFPPLYAYASVSMPPSRTASGVIFVAWGKDKDGIRNTNFCRKISTPFQG